MEFTRSDFDTLNKLAPSGRISEAVYRKYMRIYEEYTIKLKDYKH